MGVVRASELHSLAGYPLSSLPQTSQPAPQVSDEEAVLSPFIPAEGISAALVTPHRVLVTGGVLDDDRVLPFTVLRYLDLDSSPAARHAWTRPLSLRPATKSARKRRNDSAYPVCRMDQTLTFVPEANRLFLVGGLKVGGKDECFPCKTIFSFDVATRIWSTVDSDPATAASKAHREHALGPRFAHTAVALSHLPGARPSARGRSRKSAVGYILAHGGYVSCNDSAPVGVLHAFDVRAQRWALRPHKGVVDPPQRAYHAAAVVGELFVVHGGGCSDFYDVYNLSGDLYVFDLVTSLWARPVLRVGSAEPPSPRRRHSIVNGIGRHAGALILFGGNLVDGSFSSELFSLHLVPARGGAAMTAFWEKFEVRGPDPLLPIASDQLSPEHSKEHSNALVDVASSAGCMIAVPDLNKYLFIGGRSTNGMRSTPLLLDASEAEHLDRFQEPQERPAADLPVMRARPPLRLDSARPMPDEGASATHAMAPKAMSVELAAGRAGDRVEQTHARKRPRVRSPAGRPRSLVQKASIPLPSLPGLAAEIRAPASTFAGVAKEAEGNLDPYVAIQPRVITQPATNVHRVSAAPVDEPQNVKDRQGAIAYVSPDDDDEFILTRANFNTKTPDSLDLVTPPTKRRRFTRASSVLTAGGADANGAAADSSGKRDVPGSGGSDFVAASELARRGGKKSSKTLGERGRGEGGIKGKTRAAIAAENRELKREKEAEEVANRENARLVAALQANCERFQKESEDLKKDNKAMNEQMKNLLAEVQMVRPLRRLQNTLGHDPTSKTAEIPTARIRCDNQSDSQNAHSTRAGLPLSQTEVGIDSRMASLQSKIDDLQEECQELGREKEEVSKALKEAEDGHRSLCTEVNALKNRVESIGAERDNLRRQGNELRAVAKTEMAARQDADADVQRREEANSFLKRELETCRQELRDTTQKLLQEKMLVSDAQQQITVYRAQLSESIAKHDAYDSRERRWKQELGGEQGKADELKKIADETAVGKQRLEERNIELLTELETLKGDLNEKVKECNVSMAETQRAKRALEQERKEVAERRIENGTLRRGLERAERECKRAALNNRQRDSALHKLGPMLSRVVHEIGALTSSSEAYNDIRLNGSGCNASQKPDAASHSGNSDVRSLKQSASEQVRSKANEVSGSPGAPTTAARGDKVQGIGSPRISLPTDGDMVESPVPPSEDGDSVDEP